ncbi:hypothetical protein [Cellulosilyticum sp. I15G10I2]|uniref:hypothetical protein n=1 Tax=Cellulosilyticum sp. I15G10I2 TaxID=1892843 RepID=UPI00085CC147|nr:hypothetical protein [Cellulosilyticum sp. I15G10I2]
MPRNEYEQNEFVMNQNTQKLIKEAQVAFDVLKNIAAQIPMVSNVTQFAESDEDGDFIDEILTLETEDDESDFDAFDDEDDADAVYYGRGMNTDQFGYGRGYKPPYVPYPQSYPCVCRKCDLLKAKAFTNLLLGLNDLKDAFDLLPIVKNKFEEAVDSLQDAQKLFKKARFCSNRFGCRCFCKSRPKRRCKCPRK